MSPSEWSFYRDYEYELGRVLAQLERSRELPIARDTLAKFFYESQEVETVHNQLIDLCDRRLPERWAEVSRYYRAVRAMLEYPS